MDSDINCQHQTTRMNSSIILLTQLLQALEHQEAAVSQVLLSTATDLNSFLLSTSKCVILVGAVILVRRMSANLLADVDPFSETPLDIDVTHTDCNLKAVVLEDEDEEDKKELPKQLPYAEPLTPNEVRWLYKDDVNKRWMEFCGYDSLRIENAWRKRQNATNENGNSNDSVNTERVIVRGGMYDVELENMKCLSIYWPGEEWEIMRGTWFYDGTWIPLELEYSEVIEEAHLRMFQKQTLTQSSSTPEFGTPSHSYKVLHTEHFTQYHIDWHAINDVVLYSEYTPSKLMRSVTSKFGFTKTTGYRLARGYKEPATMEDKPNDIDHLVFVVHGIGQKRDTGKIIRNTSLFRECVERMKQKYFPNSTHRVEFFPVEWRSLLKLDGDIVDAITPYSVLSIRHLLNTSAMDILYYTSPLYGGEVRAGLQKELNRLYEKFTSRHPGWKGKVSVLAHSLGCVIVYDIVTGWVGFETRPPGSLERSSEGLQFPIENLFCLGSPLSVFLALRTRTPSNRLDLMPEYLCNRFYNIFHWSDPVAYRMEPLLERGYSKIEPILIPPHGGIDSQPVDPPQPQPMSNGDQSNPQSDTDEKDDSSPVDTPNRNADRGWSLWGLVRAGWNAKEGTSPTPDNPPIQPDQELSQRLDYVLQAVGIGRNYLYSVTAHTAYWTNCDVAYFVLTRIFPTLET
ncbi:phospholipase DDHD1 isoform X2 [Nasonia vitripennis]|uniref:DDHD domain-containing protein n=1 Tax=Nasonia vitripennis TaxID=7425 RepID=A0A7M7IVY8_NASVI|nr:phospholipase DDHD1 isoform X2 [Nasonia vitripennis]